MNSLNFAPRPLVQQLDAWIVDDLRRLVDEDVHRSVVDAVVVAIAGHGSQVRQQDGTDGAVHHAVGQGIQADVGDLGVVDDLRRIGDGTTVVHVARVRRQQGPKRARGQHVHNGQERGHHLAEMGAVVLEHGNQAFEIHVGMVRLDYVPIKPD
jgi:hypothetical protein